MPRAEVEWSQLALGNLDDLLAYWQQRAPEVARRVGRAILEKVDMIGDSPQANRSVIGLSQSYREAFVEQ
jgi:plasmid stabilization system protein ParE